MATTATQLSNNEGIGENTAVVRYQWTLANGETGDPIVLPNHVERSVQVTGTFGAGGNVRIEGSIDGTNYAVLTDPQGNALDIAAAKIETITEMVHTIRPDVTAGDGTTALTITVMFKGGI